MIPKIKKVLYATDLSTNSAYGLSYTVHSAKQHNANITILHVLEKIPDSMSARLSGFLDEAQRKTILEERVTYTKKRIQERLKIFAEKELKDQPEVLDLISAIEVVEGFPRDEILQMVRKLQCDVLFMGTHGKGIRKHAYLGSVARQIVGRIKKPVFIIPLPSGETDISCQDI